MKPNYLQVAPPLPNPPNQHYSVFKNVSPLVCHSVGDSVNSMTYQGCQTMLTTVENLTSHSSVHLTNLQTKNFLPEHQIHPLGHGQGYKDRPGYTKEINYLFNETVLYTFNHFCKIVQ